MTAYTLPLPEATPCSSDETYPSDVASPTALTWTLLAQREPHLRVLELQAAALHDEGADFAEAWRLVKLQLSSLVGWNRPASAGGPPWLWDPLAYEIAARQLADMLDRPLACACARRAA
jgi:hypothetical protein